MAAAPIRRIAVVDIGKTNAKVALVDLDAMAETVVGRTANAVIPDGPYAHFDTERLWAFALGGLAEAARRGGPDAVIVTTHGAAAALMADDGRLALPVLDYEHPIPDPAQAAYDAVRPAFAETGSPRLPGGLNLGAQLHWQSQAFPDAFARTRTILAYPQYWAHRLCGVAANEATSLGAHTDLWNPSRRDFSSLVGRLGWRGRMAPVRNAGDRLGPILPEIARETGLADGTPVFCGIHDSNASLYPHLLDRKAPFAVVSTGTWVIVMAVGGARIELDPDRDTLINVNAFGNPVPSARFMGGRAFTTLLGERPAAPTDAEIARVIATPFLLTPSTGPCSGPYQGRAAEWLPHDDLSAGERFAVVSFHLALMSAACLDLAGASGDIIVEGPFGANACFATMLATATDRPVAVSKGSTGTSIGAALLCGAPGTGASPAIGEIRISPIAGWADYASAWRKAVG